MATIVTPTTQEIADLTTAQIQAQLAGDFPLLPKSFQRVVAKVLAGSHVLLFKYAGRGLLNQSSEHASFKETTVKGRKIRPLVELGRRVGVGDPTPATQAELSVTVTVLNQTGSLPANSQLLRAETGVLYLSTAAVALNAATVEVPVKATVGGSLGNLEPGDVVSFASPPPNVATGAVVSAQTVTGADAETEAVYRARVQRRERATPQGGAYADYQAWGEEVEGILRVYPYTGLPGQADVYVEATVASSGSADGIPTQAQLDAVKASINLDVDGLASRRNINTFVNTLPITRVSFDVTVNGLIAVDRPAAEAQITQAIDEYLRSRETFIDGLSSLPRTDRITVSAVGGIAVEAASAIGASITTVEVDFPPSDEPDNYRLGRGERAKLGTASFPGVP